MHDRISVNNLCFPGATLATEIERWRSLGARRIGIQTAKMNAEGWDAYLEALRASGLEVETIVHLNRNRFDDDAQVETFAVDYIEKNLRVKQKGGKTWNFTDKAAANADALFVFHRDVESARKKLAEGYAGVK